MAVNVTQKKASVYFISSSSRVVVYFAKSIVASEVRHIVKPVFI